MIRSRLRDLPFVVFFLTLSLSACVAGCHRVRSAPELPSVDPVPRGAFGYGLRGMQYGPGIWSLPKLIAEAGAGDFRGVAEAYWRRAQGIW